MLKRYKIIFLMFLFMSISGCQSGTTIDHLVVGTGTPSGNKIFITDIVVDNERSVFGGIKSCCWQEAGNMNGIHNRKPPETVYVKWYDYDQDIYYGGTMLLSDKLYQYTQEMAELPKIRHGYQGRKVEKYIAPYLIFGFGEEGEVVAWISNSHDNRNSKKGRVLHEVGRIQAEVLPLPSRLQTIKDNKLKQQQLLKEKQQQEAQQQENVTSQ